MIDMIDLSAVGGSPPGKRKGGGRRLADEVPAFEALQDPAAFFEMTYPTEDVRHTLEILAQRMRGDDGTSGTIVLSGRYGLGKSHILLAAHHALSAPRVALAWSKRWGIARIELPDACRVVTRSFIQRTAENLWDVVYEAFGKSELAKDVSTYPDADTIESFLDDTPTVFVLDELERWYDALSKQNQSRNRNFIQALSEVARRNPRLTVVTSVLGEKAEPAETLRRVRPTELAFRSSTDRQQILLYRLFENHGELDTAERDAVVEAYIDAYSDAGLASLDSYRERMRATYPFTPEFLDILTKKVPNLGGFQNTRGSLRFLAKVIQATHQTRPIVSSQDLPFRERDLRRDLQNLDATGGEVVRRALGDNLESVPSDLKHRDELFSAIVYYSIADPIHAGITEDEVLFAVLDPGENPNEIKDALRRLQEYAFNLHRIENRFVFRSQENPQARVRAVAHSQQVTHEAWQTVIRETIQSAWGQTSGMVLYTPSSNDSAATRKKLHEATGTPATYLVSTTTLNARDRLRLQNLAPRRNLMLLIEPAFQPDRRAGDDYSLLTDSELMNRARIIEACKILLEGRPEEEPAKVYQLTRAAEQRRLQQEVSERYGIYVSWHRAGPDDAPVDDTWYELSRIEGLSAIRFREHFEQHFGGQPAIERRVQRLWSEYQNRPVQQLVEHFEQTPGEPIPHRADMVVDALKKLARQGKLSLQSTDGRTHCHGNVDQLATKRVASAIILPPIVGPEPPSDVPLPVHRFVQARHDPEQDAIVITWQYPESDVPYRTAVQRYTSVRGWNLGEEYKLDLDITQEANRYIDAGTSFVDKQFQKGVSYYYYVFLIEQEADAAPRTVLSQRCDVLAPLESEETHENQLRVAPQTTRQKLVTELEKLVMSSKHVPVSKVIARLEITVHRAEDMPLLSALRDSLPVGVGVARVTGDFQFVIRGPLSKQDVIKVARAVPSVPEATYDALLHLEDREEG
ncbi:MAG: ATP-binding protein [Sandaracinaceae bacterium]|nr:ATP-binding protein [Sandaracinaceae bacterium]